MTSTARISRRHLLQTTALGATAAALAMPRLTTIKTPLHKMAETAMTLILERTANPSLPERLVVTPISFVPGGSAIKLSAARVRPGALQPPMR